MSKRWFIGVTRTGKILTEVFPSAAGWSVGLNSVASSESAVFELADDVNRKLRNSSRTDDWVRSLVTVENDRVRDVRLISDWDLDRDNQRLTVNLADVQEVFASRYPFGVTSYWVDEANRIPGKFSVSGLEWRSIAVRVLQESLVGPFDIYSLPIALPAVVAGSHAMEKFFANFPRTDALLKEIRETAGGPDMTFRPRWKAGLEFQYFEWLAVFGTDVAPAIVGKVWDFYMNTTKPGLTKVRKRKDGNKKITGAFSIGAGSGDDLLVYGRGTGNEGDVTSVAMDVQDSFKDIDQLPELVQQTTSRISAFRNSTEQWSAQYLSEGDRDLSAVIPGDVFRLHFAGDFWESDGHVDLRVMTLSGDESPLVTPALQAMVVT